MECKKVFEEIDKLNDKYTDLWERLCNIESPSDFKEGIDKSCEYIIGVVKEYGWDVEVLEQRVAGNAVCITMNADSKEAPISISGHMDTVHPVGAFGSPAVHKDNEKIYGPGVTDCKGGVVAGIMAMDALEKCGFKKRPVQLLLQTDEEVGSSFSNQETINYICQKAKDSVCFLNLEGHTKGYACLIRKGIINFTFTVTGIETHSSICASEGANAILEAAHKIIELEKIKDAKGLTCCCSVINGGTVENTVPGKCVFKANVRYANAAQAEWMRNKAHQVAETVYVPGCTCEVEESTCRCAMEYSEKNVKLLESVNEIFSKNGIDTLEMATRTGGSDAAEVTCSGIPCLDSMGVRGGKIHNTGEFAYLESLKESAKRIAAVAWCI